MAQISAGIYPSGERRRALAATLLIDTDVTTVA